MAKANTKNLPEKTEENEAPEQGASIVLLVKLIEKTKRNDKGEIENEKPKNHATLTKAYPGVVGPGAVVTEDGLNQALVRVIRNDELNRTESHIAPLRFDKEKDAKAEAKRLKALGWKEEK